MWWIEEFRSWTQRLIKRENWVGERFLHDDGYFILVKRYGIEFACPFCGGIFPTRRGVNYHMNYHNGQCAYEIPFTKRMRMVERPILILKD